MKLFYLRIKEERIYRNVYSATSKLLYLMLEFLKNKPSPNRTGNCCPKLDGNVTAGEQIED